ncbi:hypothetical protein SLEP1_g55081 [Rubroshorea leprosula]|uniref:Uncharacterized protein n=1 Tax=Rubroshorea leprosula TaxID=152421 RepID=A0AAV5MEI0_9ROSI|nr:hypothetical protein SLEP1_g55081 [Rubroshorea leprosula]
MFHGRGLRLSLQDAVLMHFINMGTFSLTPKEVSDWLINPMEGKETCRYIIKEWEVTMFLIVNEL